MPKSTKAGGSKKRAPTLVPERGSASPPKSGPSAQGDSAPQLPRALDIEVPEGYPSHLVEFTFVVPGTSLLRVIFGNLDYQISPGQDDKGVTVTRVRERQKVRGELKIVIGLVPDIIRQLQAALEKSQEMAEELRLRNEAVNEAAGEKQGEPGDSSGDPGQGAEPPG